jgi:peroxiredoxin
MIKKRLWVTALLTCLLVTGAHAAELGSKAPAPRIKNWLNGPAQDFKNLDGRSTYVLFFWSTWCPYCLDCFSDLTALQNKYKAQGVVIIGVTQDDRQDVEEFLKDKGKKTGFVLATDVGRATSDGYMKAFDVDSIPHAFIVNRQGVIAWHGHPKNGLNAALEEILSGTYNLQKMVRRERSEKLLSAYHYLVTKTTERNLARQVGEKIAQYAEDDAQMLKLLALVIGFEDGIEARDTELGLRVAQKAYDLTKGSNADICHAYAKMQFLSGKTASAVELQKKAVSLCTDKETTAEYKKILEKYQQALKNV